MLLGFALPLILAAGCASDPNRSSNTSYFNETPAPIASPVSKSEAADRVVENEMFYMLLTNMSTGQDMGAFANGGVATVTMWQANRKWMDGTSFNVAERQKVVDQTWELDGVTQVNDGLGVDLAPTPESKAVALR